MYYKKIKNIAKRYFSYTALLSDSWFIIGILISIILCKNFWYNNPRRNNRKGNYKYLNQSNNKYTVLL